MVKGQISKRQTTKACFGTKEWSDNSGICNGCDLKSDCGKVNKN